MIGPTYSGICLDPLPSKKTLVKVGPPLTKLSGSAHEIVEVQCIRIHVYLRES